MERSDDLRSWRLFVTVAKTGSISSACAIFQTDAANLSRQLSLFEKSLGVGPLLDRSVRPLVLTENGKAAFECALKMLQLRDELKQNLNCDPNALAGVVRVGLPPDGAARFADAVSCVIFGSLSRHRSARGRIYGRVADQFRKLAGRPF